MYTVSKAPHGILTRNRISGSNGSKFISLDVSYKSISPPNEKSFADSIRGSSSSDGTQSLPRIGPNPVFLSSKNGANSSRRKPRPDKTPEQAPRPVKPDADVVSFFALSWNSLQTNPEAEKKTCASNDVVYYRPLDTAKVPEFTPCNYERVWADHHYRKLIRHIDLSVQNQTP